MARPLSPELVERLRAVAKTFRTDDATKAVVRAALNRSARLNPEKPSTDDDAGCRTETPPQ